MQPRKQTPDMVSIMYLASPMRGRWVCVRLCVLGCKNGEFITLVCLYAFFSRLAWNMKVHVVIPDVKYEIIERGLIKVLGLCVLIVYTCRLRFQWIVKKADGPKLLYLVPSIRRMSSFECHFLNVTLFITLCLENKHKDDSNPIPTFLHITFVFSSPLYMACIKVLM